MVLIPEDEQALILATIDGLPPDELLAKLTPSQKQHWYGVKNTFANTKSALQAFFSGKSTPLRSLSEADQELYSQYADFYISLYGVIQWGWEDILESFKNWHSEHYSDKFPWNSPGETLIAVLDRNCQAMMLQCLAGRHDFRPRKLYQLRSLEKKISQGEASPIESRRYEQDVKAMTNVFKHLVELEIFVVNSCRKAAKSRKDKALKRKLETYEIHRLSLDNLIQKRFRDMKGFAFENGEQLTTQKEGGTYKRIP